jgi:5S rRNA maturation endonuclease (ribonuclease M5)
VKRKTRYILLIIIAAFILFLIPYSRDTDGFSSEDVQWEMFRSAHRHKAFDKQSFSFVLQTEIPEELRNLENKNISMEGFLYSEKIGGEMLYLLSETRREVCAFCDHDEHGQTILLYFDEELDTEHVKDDDYVDVSGVFQITDTLKNFSPFVITDIKNIQKTKLRKNDS